MGVSIYYLALSEQSTLFKRIQTEKAFSTLFYDLVPYGNGIFHIFDIDKEELDEILDWVAESEEVFDSRADVDRCLNELCMELERAETSYPGLADQIAYLEKSQTLIEELLSQELKKRHLDNCIEYIEKLLYGDRSLAPDLYGEYEDRPLLVPSSEVQNGARVLRDIEPEALFESAGNPDSYYLEHFRRWRDFYLEAAEKGEAVIIRFT